MSYNNNQRITDPVSAVLGMALGLLLVLMICCCHYYKRGQQEEAGNAAQLNPIQVAPEEQHPPHANQVASGLSIQHYPSPMQQYPPPGPQQLQQHPTTGPQPLQQYQPYVLYYLPPQEYTPSGTAVGSNPALVTTSAPGSPNADH